jgi:membrane protein required for colicin V production
MRGLVFELLAIAGWVVAYFAAVFGGPLLAPHLPIGAAGSLLNQVVAFVGAFLLAMVVWGVLSRLVRGMVRATPLAPIDRVLGAIFGLLRGGIVLLAITALVALTPAAKTEPWQASVGAAWLTDALQSLKTVLPSDWGKVLPA